MLREDAPANTREQHFAYTPTPKGTKWQAYVAGPARWFKCHVGSRTKPCLEAVTDGELDCPRCKAGIPLTLIGYLPVYRFSDAKASLILLHENQYEVTKRLRLHAPVVVGREEGPSDGVWVAPLLAAARVAPFQSSRPDRMKPADVIPSLLKIWKINELTEWYLSKTTVVAQRFSSNGKV